MSMKPENFIYQGTFTDIAAGQQISAQLYDREADVIKLYSGESRNWSYNEARENPNLSEKTSEIVNEAYGKVKNGEIKVAAEGTGLI